MSDPNDPQTPPPPPPDEPPHSSPFPESSLTGPPAPEEPEDADPPAEPARSGLWASPPPPLSGGLASGDPLAAAPPPPPAPPAGYTSPPPPGAVGPAHHVPPAPAPGAGTFVLAGWWSRVGAAVVDGLIILAIALAIMALLGVGFFAVDSDDAGGAFALILGFFVAMLVIAFVALAYAPILMARTNGQTIGRKVCGIRVVRADGKRITLGFAALREVVVKALLIGAVAGSVSFGLASLLDVLWPLWDDENRALHDFVVNTRTVVA